MDLGYLYAWGVPVLGAVGLAVIGIVMGPKVGPGRSRMWAGLGILIALQLIAPLVQLIVIQAMIGAGNDFAVVGAVQSVWGVISGLAALAAIALLVSAATVGRGPAGHLDPSRPGAAPSAYGAGGYQGTGYPAVPGGPTPPGSEPAESTPRNPYT